MQWNGSGANKDERMKAASYLQEIKAGRGKAQSEVLGKYGGEHIPWGGHIPWGETI